MKSLVLVVITNVVAGVCVWWITQYLASVNQPSSTTSSLAQPSQTVRPADPRPGRSPPAPSTESTTPSRRVATPVSRQPARLSATTAGNQMSLLRSTRGEMRTPRPLRRKIRISTTSLHPWTWGSSVPTKVGIAKCRAAASWSFTAPATLGALQSW
jgi:hypothetical protein